MKYEFTNTDERPITRLWWPYARLVNLDVAPGNIKTSIQFDMYSCTPDIYNRQVQVDAFRNTKDNVYTTVLVRGSFNQSELACNRVVTPGSKFNFSNFSETSNGISAALAQVNALSAPVPALTIGSESYSYPALSTRFSSDDVSVLVRSTANYAAPDHVIKLRDDISVETKLAGVMALSSPFLKAPASAITSGGSLEDRTLQFLRAVPAAAESQISKDLKYSWNRQYSFDNNSGETSLFLVYQPITIKIENRKICFAFQSYSPVPVSSLSQSWCDAD